MERPNGKIHWLSQEEYDKAINQLRLQIGGALHPLRMYGQGELVDGAIVELVKLTEAFGLRVRGIDSPISLEMVKRKLSVNT